MEETFVGGGSNWCDIGRHKNCHFDMLIMRGDHSSAPGMGDKGCDEWMGKMSAKSCVHMGVQNRTVAEAVREMRRVHMNISAHDYWIKPSTGLEAVLWPCSALACSSMGSLE